MKRKGKKKLAEGGTKKGGKSRPPQEGKKGYRNSGTRAERGGWRLIEEVPPVEEKRRVIDRRRGGVGASGTAKSDEKRRSDVEVPRRNATSG